mmetsp:Transcript_71711/g.142200  ORF Transcript_71711/g.142200 Transcript_71711/m.142200 type:complete len:233 (-) Transcript_71711:647-1345(-)
MAAAAILPAWVCSSPFSSCACLSIPLVFSFFLVHRLFLLSATAPSIFRAASSISFTYPPLPSTALHCPPITCIVSAHSPTCSPLGPLHVISPCPSLHHLHPCALLQHAGHPILHDRVAAPSPPPSFSLRHLAPASLPCVTSHASPSLAAIAIPTLLASCAPHSPSSSPSLCRLAPPFLGPAPVVLHTPVHLLLPTSLVPQLGPILVLSTMLPASFVLTTFRSTTHRYVHEHR